MSCSFLHQRLDPWKAPAFQRQSLPLSLAACLHFFSDSAPVRRMSCSFLHRLLDPWKAPAFPRQSLPLSWAACLHFFSDSALVRRMSCSFLHQRLDPWKAPAFQRQSLPLSLAACLHFFSDSAPVRRMSCSFLSCFLYQLLDPCKSPAFLRQTLPLPSPVSSLESRNQNLHVQVCLPPLNFVQLISAACLHLFEDFAPAHRMSCSFLTLQLWRLLSLFPSALWTVLSRFPMLFFPFSASPIQPHTSQCGWIKNEWSGTGHRSTESVPIGGGLEIANMTVIHYHKGVWKACNIAL